MYLTADGGNDRNRCTAIDANRIQRGGEVSGYAEQRVGLEMLAGRGSGVSAVDQAEGEDMMVGRPCITADDYVPTHDLESV